MWKVYADEQTLHSLEDGLATINPKLELGLNTAGSFVFTLDSLHPLYDEVKKLATLIAVEQDGIIVWRGRLFLPSEIFKTGKSLLVKVC